jgi:hypothetical protein
MTYSTPDIYIVNGNITLFCGSHSENFKRDILHSSLLGQLVADTHNTHPNTWFASYRKTLGNLFWNLKSFNNKIIKNEPSSILSLAKTGLSGTLQKGQLQQLTDTFSIIKQLPDDSPAIEAILNKFQRENISNAGIGDDRQDEKCTFTVSILLTIVCENKTIISFQVSLETSHAVDITILDQALSEKNILGDPETTLWSTYLIEDKYASVRNQIIEKLGTKTKTNLFQISPPALTH